jgi:transposase
MKNKNIIMTSKEAKRYDIIKDLISQKINGTQAAKQLNLSIRQTKRLKRRVKEEGIKGVIHKSRGREGNHKLKRKTVRKIKKLIRENYSDFTPAFIQEKLDEKHKIKVSYGAVRNIMIKEKLYFPRKRKNNHSGYRAQRERKDYYGEMEQFDGSYYNWLEGRGGTDDLCLLASIDDARKEITRAELDYNESVKSVFHFWKEYIKKNGKPLAVYLDKYSTYKINHKNAADNKDLLTQFQRAMGELDIKIISAHSPQAKGRVERLFKTLQDRLVKELRLRKIDNVKEANKFLQKEFIPEFNKKFGVKAKKKGDLHRKLNKREKGSLNHIFSIKNQRVVRNDFIVQYQNRYFQLEEIQPITVYKKDKVIVEEHLDDSICIGKKDKYLKFTELKEKPKKEIPVKLPALTLTKTRYTPPADHPWRKLIFSQKLKKQEKIQV